MCILLTKASIAWNLFLKNLWWLKCWHIRVVLTQSLVWTEKECDTFSRGVSPHPISLPSHIVHTNIAAIVKSPKNNCYFTFGAAGYLGQSLVQSRRLLSSSCSLFKSAQLPHFRMLQCYTVTAMFPQKPEPEPAAPKMNYLGQKCVCTNFGKISI